MPTFEYQAKTETGDMVNGVVFGASLDHAARDLASQGLAVTRIGVASMINDPLSASNAPPSAFSAAPVSPGTDETSATYRSELTDVSGLNQYSAPGRTAEEQMRPATEQNPNTGAYLGREESSFQEAGPRTEGVAQREAPSIEQRSYAETSVWGPLVGQVPLPKLYMFFNQMATLLHSGVPMVQSLDTLAKQAGSPKLQSIIQEIKGHVEVGRPMSAGFQRYPEVFNPIMLSLTRAGEEGGFLDSALSQIATYLDKEISLRNLYRRLTLMPKLQVFASIAIIVIANAIIGSIRPDAQHLASPLTNLATWIWLGPLVVGLFLFFRVGLANPRIRYNWDFVGAHIPGLGKMLRELAAARFGRAFGALHKGGVPIVKSIQMSADACGNEYLRSLIHPAATRLEDGAGIAEILRDTQAFSPIVIDMIATGEHTGNLDLMLQKMADFYEEEATMKSTQVAVWVGVLLGLAVAIYIGYIVISFYTGYAQQYTPSE